MVLEPEQIPKVDFDPKNKAQYDNLTASMGGPVGFIRCRDSDEAYDRFNYGWWYLDPDQKIRFYPRAEGRLGMLMYKPVCYPDPRKINHEKVRGYDCTKCGLHFEAETEYGDAYEFDPDCPRCGDPTGFNCRPCGGDPRNGEPFPAVIGSASDPQVDVRTECMFPDNKHVSIVPLKRT